MEEVEFIGATFLCILHDVGPAESRGPEIRHGSYVRLNYTGYVCYNEPMCQSMQQHLTCVCGGLQRSKLQVVEEVKVVLSKITSVDEDVTVWTMRCINVTLYVLFIPLQLYF